MRAFKRCTSARHPQYLLPSFSLVSTCPTSNVILNCVTDPERRLGDPRLDLAGSVPGSASIYSAPLDHGCVGARLER